MARTASAAAAFPVAFLLAGCASTGAPADTLTADQIRVLETIASDDTASLCVLPVLRGRLEHGDFRFPPRGFADLSRDRARHRDLRLTVDRIGRLRVADDPDCFTLLVPRIADDRAVAAIFFPVGFTEFGLRREAGGWRVVERRETDIF